MKGLTWVLFVALLVGALDIVLIWSKRSLLVHVHEYAPGATIKTQRFGDVDGGKNPTVVCTYWTGRSAYKVIDAPHKCVFLGMPTGMPIGE